VYRQLLPLIFALLAVMIGVGMGSAGEVAHPFQPAPSSALAVADGALEMAVPLPRATAGQARSACNSISRNPNGSYSFSWLHVSSSGQIVDVHNCPVLLAGFNMGDLSYGDADAGIKLSTVQWYKRTFPMNVVRVQFNARWWDKNVYVPGAHEAYRNWLRQYVSWQEQVGNYVILDNGPHFAEPPCGGRVSFCPTQDQGEKDYQSDPNPETAKGLETYLGFDLPAWKDLATLYAHDPAMLYDAWNEPAFGDLPTLYSDMNSLINTIRASNPNALIFVYRHGFRKIMSGKYPDYSQPNLVIDLHIYPSFNGTSPATNRSCVEHGRPGWSPQTSGINALVQFARSHGQAVIIGEWGGCYDLPRYDRLLVSYAQASGIGLIYYREKDVLTNSDIKHPHINSNGLQVRAAYAALLAHPL
jgi:hypothetical protein